MEICSSTLRVFSLRVNDETDEAARYLLDSVTFPNMEALELDIGRSTTADEGPHEHIYGFLRRCKAPLTSFAFCSEETDEHDLMRYLQLMPSLQDLKLTDIIKLTEEGVRALTLRGNRTDNLCPKLESLSFYDRTLEDDPLGSSDFLTVMLMSRWLGASGALKKFRLCGCGCAGSPSCPLYRCVLKMDSRFCASNGSYRFLVSASFAVVSTLSRSLLSRMHHFVTLLAFS